MEPYQETLKHWERVFLSSNVAAERLLALSEEQMYVAWNYATRVMLGRILIVDNKHAYPLTVHDGVIGTFEMGHNLNDPILQVVRAQSPSLSWELINQIDWESAVFEPEGPQSPYLIAKISPSKGVLRTYADEMRELARVAGRLADGAPSKEEEAELEQLKGMLQSMSSDLGTLKRIYSGKDKRKGV